MKSHQRIFISIVFCLCLAANISAQSGGDFVIKQGTVSSGGGDSGGGAFGAKGTAGQPVAGTTSAGGQFAVTGGFWQSVSAPTAAMTSISGQVLTANQDGITNVRVTLTDQSGSIRMAVTSPFGFYRFDNVEAGQIYIVSVQSKRFRFASPTQSVIVGDEVSGLNFIAMP